MRWGGRWEGGSGWGTHVHPWLIHVNLWQKPPQYCKVISLQLKKKEKKRAKKILKAKKKKFSSLIYVYLNIQLMNTLTLECWLDVSFSQETEEELELYIQVYPERLP